MLAILHARRTTRHDHEASPQWRRYEEELTPWRRVFGEPVDLFADTPGRIGALRRSQIVRVLHPSGALPALAAKRWFGTPFVVHVGYDPARLCRLRGAPARARAWDAWLRLLAHEATGFLVSANPQRWARSKTRVFYAPNGVNPSRLYPAPRGPKSDPPVVLFVGRLSPEKNLSMLLRAFARVRTVAELVLVGEGPERATLEAEARFLGISARVRMPGAVSWECLPEWYQRASLFVLPSLTEGSPKALFEAMASGVPVCASAALEDRPPWSTCWFPPPGDPGAWADAIERHLVGGDHADRAARALTWVRRKRDARVLIRREVAFVLALSRGVEDPVRWVEHETAMLTTMTEGR